ncbi:MAG: PAS domain S-box protein [Bacteroidetes bacterium]|nr:MAG: PAS domain S-box protein [Bacteroidota bacterium]
MVKKKYSTVKSKDHLSTDIDSASTPDNKLSGKNSFSRNLVCVGIGASAGGLEALELFFKNMNPKSGLAFVVVQHLSPDYKSLMVELLSKHTRMNVLRAEDGMEVLPDSIYLIPPKKNMTIFHGKLFLTEQNHQHVINLPIDIFFRSLADDFADRAIGVILSGTGSDGTLGIRAIKGAGGMVMAQDDTSAKFDGMPKSAIATGLVDYVIPAERMPKELLKYVEHPLSNADEEEKDLSIFENSLAKIMALIREKVGVDFSYYKPNTIIRRLERRISINQIESFEAYISFLQQSPSEVNILYKELLIGVTKFFRDTESFEIIKQQVIPQLLKNKEKDETIRIWSVGCSTGEEAYSIAILLKEFMDFSGQERDVKIFATDLDKESIEYGSFGFYPESIMADVSVDRLKKYFTKKEKGYLIQEDIRKMVIFATHNIIKDPPFSKIDLISCRNMLIYLKPVMQKKILTLFHFSMSKNGFLFLGSSESLGDHTKNFNTISSKWKIYTYKEGFTSENVNDLLVPNLSQRKKSKDLTENAFNVPVGKNVNTENIFESVINEFIPPSIIINENYEIVHIFNDVNKFVNFPAGKASFDILNLIRKELSTTITIAIHKAFKENKEIVYKDFKLKEKGSIILLNIKVKPLKEKSNNLRLLLIAIEEKKTYRQKSTDKHQQSVEYDTNQQIKDLELELKYTKENLQATIEELGTSNEELQATNEELISSNEELQSTNEELQSVNEELYTVNSEYQNKIEELTQLNNDINNLLKNTSIGTIFLDRNLRIRKFTPAVASAINILDMDIGRPIHHLALNSLYATFIEDIENVLRTLIPKETEVQGKNKNWFFMRILPYRTVENAIDGVVITFFDITERKLFEEKIERKSKLLISVLNNSPIASTILDNKGNITYANQMAEKVLGLSKKEIISRNYNAPKWKITDVHGNSFPQSKLPFSIVKKTAKPVFDIVHNIQWPNGNKITLSINGSPIFDENEQVEGVVCTLLDITEKRKLEDKLIQERDLLTRILENSPVAKLVIDKNKKVTFANALAKKIFNIKENHLSKGITLKKLGIHPQGSDLLKPDIVEHVIHKGGSVFNIIHTLHYSDNSRLTLNVNASPVFDESKQVVAAVLSLEQKTS